MHEELDARQIGVAVQPLVRACDAKVGCSVVFLGRRGITIAVILTVDHLQLAALDAQCYRLEPVDVACKRRVVLAAHKNT